MNSLSKKALRALVLLSSILIQACSSSISSKTVASLAFETGSCESFETLFHDKLQTSFQNYKALPDVDSVVYDFEETIKERINEKDLDQEQLIKLKENLRELYTIIIEEAKKDPTLKELIKLEYHNHDNKTLQEDYNKSLNSYVSTLKNNYEECNPIAVDNNNSSNNEEEIEPMLPFYEELASKTNRAQFGAIKSFSVAYQSCSAHSQKPLDHPDEKLEGIKRIGTHPSGGGIRVIENMEEVLTTHPYIVNNRVPSSVVCDDPKVSPKIYDFGGKPFATSEVDSSLNYFIEGGTGSNELGVDCSGYVFSALMSAGLKLAPHKPLRARGVYATPAKAWKELGEDMSCFKKVKTGSKAVVQPGDLFASNGHIFIINKVGADPLGVNQIIESGESCSTVSHENFDFTVFQSSPTNGAIGLNHMQASYYLSDSETMMNGFEKFAKKHCENLKNNLQESQNIQEASLIRHKMTPDCMEEKVIKLDYESCLERCSSDEA